MCYARQKLLYFLLKFGCIGLTFASYAGGPGLNEISAGSPTMTDTFRVPTEPHQTREGTALHITPTSLPFASFPPHYSSDSIVKECTMKCFETF
jgi:hypothetical protein